MKISNIKNIEGLFAVINSCEGTVELVTSEGDRLNLKSNLCKYVALAKIFSPESGIGEMELIAHDPVDASRLMKFLISGNIK